MKFEKEVLTSWAFPIALGVIVGILGPDGWEGIVVAGCVCVIALVFLQALKNRD